MASARFLFLKNLIINIHHIQHITRSSEKYVLRMNQENFSGFILFGSGGIQSEAVSITVEKSKHLEEYEILTKWLAREERKSPPLM
jgi:hypothetical protein